MTQIEIAQRNKKIKELAQEGKTVDEIASVFNMKRSRVMMILRSYKVKPGKISHQLHCEMAKNIIAELEKGTMQSEIAKKFNVSRQYVSQIKFKLQGK
jgi:transcriptional regulator with XRE-family HTH domain